MPTSAPSGPCTHLRPCAIMEALYNQGGSPLSEAIVSTLRPYPIPTSAPRGPCAHLRPCAIMEAVPYILTDARILSEAIIKRLEAPQTNPPGSVPHARRLAREAKGT